MDITLQDLMNHVENTKSRCFEIEVLIRENQSYAALDLDLKALNPVLFAAGVAEFIYCYSEYLFGKPKDFIYSDEVFKSFESEGLVLVRKSTNTLEDMCALQGEQYKRIFEGLLRRRNPGIGLAASAETLRLELVEIQKINPTKLRMVVTYAMSAAGLILVLTYAGLQIAKLAQAPECVQQRIAYAETKNEAVRRMHRLEGKLSPLHVRLFKNIDDSMNAGIAACYPDFTTLDVFLKRDGVDISAGGKETPKIG